MNTALYLIVVGYPILSVGLAIMLILMWYGVLRTQNEQCTAVMSLVKDGDLTRALEYVDRIWAGSLHSKAMKVLLSAKDTPHMIPLVYEEAVLPIRNMVVARNIIITVNRTLYLLCGLALGWDIYMTSEPTFTVKACLVVSILSSAINSYYLAKWSVSASSLHLFMVQLKNEMLLQLGYIPPYCRSTPASKTDLDQWRKTMRGIEKDVLLGMSPDEAHNKAIELIQNHLDRCSYTSEGVPLVRPPASRASMILDDK